MNPREQVDAVMQASASSGRHYRNSIPMIASENILSPLVAGAIQGDLHGRYAEGLPGKRYYQGCDDFDTIESIGIDSAKRVFNCQFANIQSTSGTVSNMGALKALTKPGDTITAVSTADGGHISHHPMGAVGMRGLNLVTYPWDEERMEPDVDAASAIIRSEQPELCLFGQSVILFPIQLQELADVAHEVGARVMYDGAHVLGLIAGGEFQDPLREGADVMTGSSHKTFPGPQGGFLLSDSEEESLQKKLNNAIFPGVCSSYHLHHVAGKVVAMAEFEAHGEQYARDIVANARALGSALAEEGFDVIAEERNFTSSHQILTRHGGPDSGAGKSRSKARRLWNYYQYEYASGDTKAMSGPSGLRLGTPELTRIGMGANEMIDVAKFFAVTVIRRNPERVKSDIAQFKPISNSEICNSGRPCLS